MSYVEVFFDESTLMVGHENGVTYMAPSASPSNPTDVATIKAQAFYFKPIAAGPERAPVTEDSVLPEFEPIFLCTIEGSKPDFDTWYAGITPGPGTAVEVANDSDIKYRQWGPMGLGSGEETGSNTPSDQWAAGLAATRNAVIVEVDGKSKDLIFSGFEYPAASGQIFSLSMTAQQKWTNLFLGKDILTYPIRVTTSNEATDVSLAGAADVTAFYTAFIERARAVIDEGRDLKIEVQGAADIDTIATKRNDNKNRA